MVQGLPAVKWTPENNHKLLQALVIIHAGTPDYKKLASVFGKFLSPILLTVIGLAAFAKARPDVPVDAIQYRIRTLRKEGATLGISDNNSPAKSSQAKRMATSTGKKSSNGRKRTAPTSEDTDNDEGMNTDDALARQLSSPNPPSDNTLSTSKDSKKVQKVISGRVTKARKSPRAATKKDYKALGDPFVATLNSDGEKVFPTDRSDSEDSFASDKGYSEGHEDSIEMGEAI